jgi:AcrR family transcriptional regulator
MELSHAGPARPRNAAETRQRLLDSARRRFAEHGYAATTVREIADDAGVNVALISRYFDSKEGLFAACLNVAVNELHRADGDTPLDQIPAAMASQIAGVSPDGRPNPVLMLLLRSSGDERADEIRVGLLRSYAERLARAAGWRPGHPDGDRLLLRAQATLAAAIGIIVFRSSAPVQPIAAASEAELADVLRGLVDGLFAR